MSKNKKDLRKFVVQVNLPADVYMRDMAEYIEDAVVNWKGGFHPDDSLTQIKREDVKVTQYRRPRKPKS